MPRQCRRRTRPVDGESVALRLDSHRLVERERQRGIRIVRSQRGAQIDLLAPAQTGEQLAGRGDPDTIAAGAEIVGLGVIMPSRPPVSATSEYHAGPPER